MQNALSNKFTSDRGVATNFCLGGDGFIGTQTYLTPKLSFSSDFGHFILKLVENAKQLFVSRKKTLKYHNFWEDVPRWFFDCRGRVPPSPSLSTPMTADLLSYACWWHLRSSFTLQTTYPRSSVTPALAGCRPSGMWRSPCRPPAVVVDLAWGPHTRHEPMWPSSQWWRLQKPGPATRARFTLVYSNPSPSSHGSAMVRLDRRGLILTKQKALEPPKRQSNEAKLAIIM